MKSKKTKHHDEKHRNDHKTNEQYDARLQQTYPLHSLKEEEGQLDALEQKVPPKKHPVPLANTAANPGAMMVVGAYTAPAVPAMLRSKWLIQFATLAEAWLEPSLG